MTARWRLTSWLAVLAWAGLIFYLSAQPNLTITHHGTLDFILRKSAHMAAFGILFFLLWLATGSWARNRAAIVLSGFLTLAYAASDEYHQSFVPGRGAEVSDVFIDFAGAVIVAIAILIIRWRRREASGGGNPAGAVAKT